MIEVKDLTKTYGQHKAIDNLSFRVEKGEIVGFLGPNGAGKSTTMNIITGYISATEGSAMVDGYDVLDDPMEVKKRIGYLPELPPLYIEMTVYEYLTFASEIKKVDKRSRRKDIERVMEIVRITDHAHRLIKNLSKGYRQRTGLAQALLGNPPVLILDEPTIGLDPNQIVEIRSLIKELGKEHTLILSSHVLPEVTAVCERVMIIHKGKIVASDTIENLSKNLTGSHNLSVRISGPEKEASNLLKGLSDVKKVEILGEKEPKTVDIYVEADGSKDIREPVFRCMCQAGYPILQMRSMDLTLEDIFIQLTTDEANGRREAS